MYCPACGSEERQRSQYCRACGTDLKSVRLTLEKTDAITESATFARSQIGRAVADKIHTIQSAKELHKIAEDVLPEIEKFLESPAEKRLRRLRTGTIMACIGMGGVLGALVASVDDKGFMVLTIPGLIFFFIGLGIMLNGLLFTVPRKEIPDHTDEARSQLALDSGSAATAAGFLPVNDPRKVTNGQTLQPSSVTEHTTHQLTTER